WSLDTGQSLEYPIRVSKTDAHISSMALSPEGRRATVLFDDGECAVCELQNGEMKLLAAHSGGALITQFSPDGRCFLTGGRDHVLRVWNTTTQAEIVAINCSNDVNRASFDSTGKYVVTYSGLENPDLLAIWDWEKKQGVFSRKVDSGII